MSTILTTWIGVHYGNVLDVFKNEPKRLLAHWTVFSSILVALGLIVHYAGLEMNKQLWTPSYMLFTAGVGGFSLVVFYCILDYKTPGSGSMNINRRGKRQRLRRALQGMLQPMRWVGLNTIFVFLCADSSIPYNLQAWVYYERQQWNLVDSIYRVVCSNPYVEHDPPWTFHTNTLVCGGGMFAGKKEKWAELFFTLLRIGWWSLVAGWLHHRKWYWAL